MAEIIAQDGDITMPELSAALFDATRVQAPPNAIGKVLRKLGYTHKKSLERFAKNLNHRFSRNAVLRSIVARVPPLADTAG